MRGHWLSAVALGTAVAWLGPAPARGAAASWLDEPLRSWVNVGALGIPQAGDASWRPRDTCLGPAPEGAEAVQLRAAGWRAFQFSDRAITRGDVTVQAGLRALTPDCAPAEFQVFVFVAGQYAGTLSPAGMTAGKDGVIGMVRVLPGDVITAEFARYADRDSECCPSGRVRVRYRVERPASGPRVVPVDRTILRQ